MLEVEEILKNLVKYNTIADKENAEILDYIENLMSSTRIYNREKRKNSNNV